MTVRDHPIAQDSAVVNGLSGIRNRVVAACKQSRIAEPARGALRQLRSLRTTEEKEMGEAKPAVANSRLLGMTRRLTTAVSNAGSASRLAGIMVGGRHLVESSWLYRWLTAEPDPDVVVIDLRETLTVGPWLRLLRRTIEWILPAALSSLLFRGCRRINRILTRRPVQMGSVALGAVAVLVLALTAQSGDPSPVLVGVGALLALLAAVGSRVTWTWTELRETRGYQVLAKAFEPPEPPEPAGQERHDRDSSDRTDEEKTR